MGILLTASLSSCYWSETVASERSLKIEDLLGYVDDSSLSSDH